MAASVGSVVARLALDWSEWSSGLTGAGERLRKFGDKVQFTGFTLGIGLTVPLQQASKAAIGAFESFDTTMTRIVTLTGAAEASVASWRDEILQLAPALGQTPEELATALYRITSAGYRGAEAFDILKVAAKASAVGLGETVDIGVAVSAAMKAYQKDGLTAARATDILIAAVRAGAAEADEMAGSFGRVVGIAAQVGVPLEQVAAFVATFTRLGVDADEAVTALRGSLLTLIKPSKGAEEALRSVGLSTNELRASIKENGLTSTLISLVQAFRGNEEGLAAVVPNVRALAGVLGVAGGQAEDFKAVEEEIINSHGLLSETFTRASGTIGYSFKQLRADVGVLANSIGKQLAPALKDVVESSRPLINQATDLAASFSSLSPGVQEAVVVFGLFVIAAGPVLYLYGSVIGLISLLVSGFTALIGAIGAAVGVFSSLAYAVVVVTGLGVGLSALITAGLIVAVVALAAAVAYGAVTIYQHWLDIKIAVLSAIAGILDGLAQLPGVFFAVSIAAAAAAKKVHDALDAARSEKIRIDFDEEPITRLYEMSTAIPPLIDELDAGAAAWTLFGGVIDDALLNGRTRIAQQTDAMQGLVEQVDQATQLFALFGDFKAPQLTVPGLTVDQQKILTDLAAKMQAVRGEAELFGPSFNYADAAASAMEQALQQLLDAGLDPASYSAQHLRDEINALRADMTKFNQNFQLAGTIAALTGDVAGGLRAQLGAVTSEMGRLLEKSKGEVTPAIADLQTKFLSLTDALASVEKANNLSKGTDKIAEALKTLNEDLAASRDQALLFGSSFDQSAADLQSYETALQSLLKEGLDPTDARIQAIVGHIRTLRDDTTAFTNAFEQAAFVGALFGDETATLQDQLQQTEGKIRKLADASKGQLTPEIEALLTKWQGLSTALEASKGFDQQRDAAKSAAKALADVTKELDAIDRQFALLGSGDTASLLEEKSNALKGALGKAADANVSSPQVATVQVDYSQIEESKKIAEGLGTFFEGIADGISEAFHRSARGVIQGTLTIRDAFANLGQSIALSWGSSMVKLVADWLAAQAKTLAISVATQLGLISTVTAGQQAQVAATVGGEAEKTAAAGAGAAARQGISFSEIAATVGSKLWEGAVWVAVEGKKLAISAATAIKTGVIWLATHAQEIAAKAIEVGAFVAGEGVKLLTSLFTSEGVIAGAIGATIAWVTGAASTAIAWIATGIELITTFITAQAVAGESALSTAIGWIGSAIGTAVAWAVAGDSMIATWIQAGAEALVNALIAAYGWIAAAAAGGASAVAPTPYVGPILAIAAAAAIVGGLTAMVLSIAGASHGADIGEDQMLFVHKGEMVLPPKLAGGVRDMISHGDVGRTPNVETASGLGDGYRQPVQVKIYTYDSKDMGRFLKRNRGAMLRELAEGVRDFDPNARHTARGAY